MDISSKMLERNINALRGIRILAQYGHYGMGERQVVLVDRLLAHLEQEYHEAREAGR